MIKHIFFLKRKPGITPQEFREIYETSHVALAQKYAGHLFVEYRRNYPIFASLNPTNTVGTQPKPYDLGYDAITELVFKDEAAVEELARIFNEHRDILQADNERFLDEEATVMIICNEVTTNLAMTTEPEGAK